jgi:hypothetical protein
MTYFVNLRAGPYGSVCDPYVLEGDGTATPPAMTSVFRNALPILAKGKDVLLAAHGFNVSYENGLCSLGHLEAALNMRRNELFLGVLWPGDWVIPAINYPFEYKIASHGGALLGGFCNRWLASARSISFLSHSLGARVVLEAIKASVLPIRRACITAGAISADCLTVGYKGATKNCGEIRTLSSMMDLVLEFAYPPGDLMADILDPDHAPFEPALGRGGPIAPHGPTVLPSEIADSPPYGHYDHSDYFPPSIPTLPPAHPNDKWRRAVAFMASAFRGQAPTWP